MIPDPNTLVLFVAATLALTLTPGPSVLYIVDRSAEEGRLVALASAFRKFPLRVFRAHLALFRATNHAW